MKNETNAPGTKDVGTLLKRLAASAVAAQLINVLYHVADLIYIGHMEEVGQLAGAGVCLPLILIISAFAALVSAGAAPRASIFLEKNDKASAERVLGNSVALLLCFSAVLTFVFVRWSEPLLLAFGASKNTIGYALDYIRIYALGTVFVQLTLGLSTFIAAEGFAKTSMYMMLTGAILNVILDPIFIFALGMGVKGAALATVLSQAVSMVWTLRFLTSPKTTLRIRRDCLKLKWAVVRPVLAQGSAPFLMLASESILIVCCNSSLLRCGGDIAVGAMSVLASCSLFVTLLLVGLAQGAQAAIRYNYGAENPAHVRKTVKLLLRDCIIYAVPFWALAECFPEVFVRLFNNDPAFVAFSAKALRIYAAAGGLFSIQIACQQAFVALGQAKSAVSVAVLRKFVLLIPLIYILPHAGLPVSRATAVFLAAPIADFISVAYTAILSAVIFRRTMAEIGDPALAERQKQKELKKQHKILGYKNWEGQRSGFYRLLTCGVRAGTKPVRTEWEVPYDGRPAVFVGNHDRAYGPIAMCAWFDERDTLRPWINAQMLSTREAPAYIRKDFWWDPEKPSAKLYDYTLAYLAALCLPPILRGSDCIPVYHDTGVATTLKKSVRTIGEGKNILLFPERPTGFLTYDKKINAGFVSLGRLCWARTKKAVSFYPVHIDWDRQLISVGAPIPYDPAVKYAEQVKTTAEAIEKYFQSFGE